jgi:hypothetical protein
MALKVVGAGLGRRETMRWKAALEQLGLIPCSHTIACLPRGPYQPQTLDDKFGSPRPLIKPFGLAIDPKGRAWVVGNAVGFKKSTKPKMHTGGLYRISKDGTIVTIALPEDRLLSFPMGIAGEARVFGSESGNTGGLTIPWGDFVDGNDTVWVFNFGVDPNDSSSQITAISQFCGAGKCPAHLRLGDATSPPTGYLSDALDRVTGGGVDQDAAARTAGIL